MKRETIEVYRVIDGHAESVGTVERRVKRRDLTVPFETGGGSKILGRSVVWSVRLSGADYVAEREVPSGRWRVRLNAIALLPHDLRETR